jgi:IS30 family transposase
MSIISALEKAPVKRSGKNACAFSQLSEDERDGILKASERGVSNQAIADILGVSQQTIGRHLNNQCQSCARKH